MARCAVAAWCGLWGVVACGPGVDGEGGVSDGSQESTTTGQSSNDAGTSSGRGGSSGPGSTGRPQCVGDPPAIECVYDNTEDAGPTVCSDLSLPPECIEGAWRCGPGHVPDDECICYSFANGLQCVMADASGCSDVLVPSVCDAAARDWTCPEGSVPADACQDDGSTGGSSTGA